MVVRVPTLRSLLCIKYFYYYESGLELSTIKVINRKSDKSKIVSDSFFQIFKLNRTS